MRKSLLSRYFAHLRTSILHSIVYTSHKESLLFFISVSARNCHIRSRTFTRYILGLINLLHVCVCVRRCIESAPMYDKRNFAIIQLYRGVRLFITCVVPKKKKESEKCRTRIFSNRSPRSASTIFTFLRASFSPLFRHTSQQYFISFEFIRFVRKFLK